MCRSFRIKSETKSHEKFKVSQDKKCKNMDNNTPREQTTKPEAESSSLPSPPLTPEQKEKAELQQEISKRLGIRTEAMELPELKKYQGLIELCKSRGRRGQKRLRLKIVFLLKK